MKFFYQSGAMGFDGKGWGWHKLFDYKFPKLPVVTKTITYYPKKGRMFPVIPIPFTKSVWNRIGLANPGLVRWLKHCYDNNLILSLYIDSYDDLMNILYVLKRYQLKGIELNISCPNVKVDGFYNITYGDCIEAIKKKCKIEQLFLKVRNDQNLYAINNLRMVDRIHINSISSLKGGVSGKLAQEKNWNFIDKWQGLDGIPPIAGCSWTDKYDLEILRELGCEYVGIGSVIIVNPKTVEELSNDSKAGGYSQEGSKYAERKG